MIWLRLLMFTRPVWQLAVLILYSFGLDAWQRAALAILGSIYVVTNALLSMLVEDPRWHQVRRVTVLLEATATLAASFFMVWSWPLGPVSLLLLPTLVSYAWLFHRDAWQWLVLLGMTVVYLVSVRRGVGMTPDWNISNQATFLPVLVLVMYGAVILFGTLVAFLLQLQKRESERLQAAMVQLEEQSELLARVNDQVNHYADQMYGLATAEERNRIAGEIHDTVAHRLTALLVQLQAARRMMLADGDVVTARGNLEVCEALTRESLDEVRHSVRAIRRTQGSEGLDVLHRLAVHFASLTGMHIDVQIDTSVGSLPAQMVAVLYRVIQEALTNAQRHGRATRVAIALRRAGSQLLLEVADNGKGAPSLQNGFGLSTMSERVTQLGGDVRTETEPGRGFKLMLRLPVWEGVRL